MNKNEECLLKFLGQPGRLDKTTAELKKFVCSAKNNVIKPDIKIIKKHAS